jgi:hypothetical protein
MEALYQAIRYAYSTRHSKIVCGPGRGQDLFKTITTESAMKAEALAEGTMFMFSDSSHGGAKPMAGFLAWLYGGPTHWGAYKLPMTSLSSAEGEYVAATKATTHGIALRATISFMDKESKPPTVLFCDNMAAVQLSENNTSSKRLKHIATRIAYLRECVADGVIQLYHIRTTGMVADIFTKPLPAGQFHVLRRLIMT